MPVQRIVPDVHADDPGASRAFYVDVARPRSRDGSRLGRDVRRARATATAQISVMQDDASASVQPDVSIEVDDVDAVHAAAQRAGYEIVHPLTDEPWGVRRFFVRDPNGKMLNILSHR